MRNFFGENIFIFSSLGLKVHVANLDVMALYLSERLNNKLYYTLEEYFFSGRIYIFFPPFLSDRIKIRPMRQQEKRRQIL